MQEQTKAGSSSISGRSACGFLTQTGVLTVNTSKGVVFRAGLYDSNTTARCDIPDQALLQLPAWSPVRRQGSWLQVSLHGGCCTRAENGGIYALTTDDQPIICRMV